MCGGEERRGRWRWGELGTTLGNYNFVTAWSTGGQQPLLGPAWTKTRLSSSPGLAPWLVWGWGNHWLQVNTASLCLKGFTDLVCHNIASWRLPPALVAGSRATCCFRLLSTDQNIGYQGRGREAEQIPINWMPILKSISRCIKEQKSFC